MRIGRVAPLVFLLACGGDGTQPGAYLQIEAIPDGATEVEVVMSDPPQRIGAQRTDTGFGSASGPVPYYRQRWSTGGLARVRAGSDTMLVRIEPAADPSTSSELVPIVIARGTPGDDSTIVAMATLPGSDGPATMQLVTATAMVYEVPLQPIAQVAAGAKPAAAQLGAYVCPGEGLAGYAWANAGGDELRLVRPGDLGSGDGSTLPLDLDCDQIAADAGDCDDLRDDVYPDAPLVCDGTDHACDGTRFWGGGCGSDPGSTACARGRALCDELAPKNPPVCVVPPTPQCPTQDGVVCTLQDLTELQMLCEPAVGRITLPPTICQQPPCTVRVQPSPGAWVGKVAGNFPNPSFAETAVTDGDGNVWIGTAEATNTSGSGAPVPMMDLGVIDLFVAPGSAAGAAEQYFGVALVAHPAQGTECNVDKSGQGSGVNVMVCGNNNNLGN